MQIHEVFIYLGFSLIAGLLLIKGIKKLFLKIKEIFK